LIDRSLTAGRYRLVAAPTANGDTAMSALASFRVAR